MPSWSDRVVAATNAWKARLEQGNAPRGDDGASLDVAAFDALERAMRELSADLTRVVERLAATASRATELEQRAMQAIRDGDDAGAREALLAHRECIEKQAGLEADADVLRTSIAECEVMQAERIKPADARSEDPPPRSDTASPSSD